MRLLPEAFLYRYEGMTPCKNGQCYRLSFTPNPQFDPSSEEAKIFRGMAGEVWIDPTEERMVKLDAPPDRGGRFWLGDYRQAPQGRNDSAGAAPCGRPPVGTDPHAAQSDRQGTADQVTQHSYDRRRERILSCEPRMSLSESVPLRLYRRRPGDDGPRVLFTSSAEQLLERDQDVVIDAKPCFLRLRSGLLLQFRSGEVDIHRG